MRASPTRRRPRRRSGFGFRCGFLGLLHLEIITERLEREFNLDLITTAPSVIYHIHLTDGTMIEMHNPADMPDTTRIDRIEEPWIKATILVPDEYLGARAEAVPGPARAAEEPHLRRHARACSSTSCRSTRWCSTSTIA